MSPVLSIIIATRHRPGQLRRCLESLTGQTYPREMWELIIVHDGKDDPSEDVVASFETRLPIRSFRREHAGCGLARNTGAAEAVGEHLIFTDDDCVLPPDWLSRYDATIRRDPSRMIAGASVNGLTSNRYARATQAITDFLLHHANSDPEGDMLALGNNMCVPRRRFHEMQGFSARYYRTAAEDRDLCARWLAAGGRIVFDPGIVVLHAHDLTLRSFLRQHYNYGRGALLFHRMQAERHQRAFRMERIGFYVELLSHPTAADVRLLLVLSQVAHTVGFVSGRFGPGHGSLT